MKWIKLLLTYIRKHRYIFGMLPKNWTEEDELLYLSWAKNKKDSYPALLIKRI